MANQPKSQYLALLTSIFGFTAFILMWIGSVRCNFVKFTDTADSSVTREFGIWYYQSWATIFSSDGTFIVKTCQSYPDSATLDASWKAARAFCVLAFIFAIIVIIIKTCIACSSDPDKGYSGTSVAPLYLLTAVFQGLSLLFLNSNACKNNDLASWSGIVWSNKCSIAAGAKCIISATVFWAAAALSSFQEEKVLKEEQNERVQPVSLTEPLNP